MRVLIAEDDFVARRILGDILSPHGDCDVVVDGDEAVQAFRLAREERRGYDLICMDIMMPNMDGQEALRQIRDIEKENGIKESDGVKVLMVTALGDPGSVFNAYKGGADSYVVKPISKTSILKELRKLGLIG